MMEVTDKEELRGWWPVATLKLKADSVAKLPDLGKEQGKSQVEVEESTRPYHSS